MGLKRFVIGLCVLLTACGGGFHSAKPVASTALSVTSTDETLTPDHSMTIQPQPQNGTTTKPSPISLGFLALEEPRFERTEDGDLRLEARLVLRDNRAVVHQENMVLTGSWDQGEEHPVLFPEKENDQVPVRARLTCLEGQDGSDCQRVLIDIFMKFNGKIHATQFEAKMSPRPYDAGDSRDEQDPNAAVSDEAAAPPAGEATSDTGATAPAPGAHLPDAPAMETPAAAAPAKPAPPAPGKPAPAPAAPAKQTPAPSTPWVDPPAHPKTEPSAPKIPAAPSNPPKPGATTAAPAPAPAKPAVTPAPSAPAKPAPSAPAAKPAPVPAPAKPATETQVTPAKPTTTEPPVVEEDDDDAEEGIDPTDRPSIYVGTLYQGADELLSMKRPERKPTPRPPQRPAPTRPAPAPTHPSPQPTTPHTPAPTTPVAPPKTYPAPPQRPGDLAPPKTPPPQRPTTPAPAPEHPSSPVPRPSVTPTGARPTNQAFGSPDYGHLERASSLRGMGGPFQLLQAQRERYYATYDLVETVNYLSKVAQSQSSMGPLRVGDLSQRTGGHLGNSAHRSHQNGLDADIGYPVDPAYRERGFAPMVSGGVVSSALHIKDTWTLFKSAWALHRVDRIFVDGRIKAALCTYASRTGDIQSYDGRELLRALRPTAGHHNHFHLRIRCSTSHPACRQMGPPPPGTGC